MIRTLLSLALLASCFPIADDTDTNTDTDTDTVEETSIDCSQVPFFGDQPDFATSGTVMGRVTSPSGSVPLAGAQVEVAVGNQLAWTLSGEAGCFHLDLRPGEHELTVTKGRYG
ncbi:MAG: carboxypeptidase regulatory-like domain-containing protein, partial [Deltaproteobacteria bacterium]|nr:carboxypeptidase regulatory-like domain-containing protein [Deltaproteobacteria bacterium]